MEMYFVDYDGEFSEVRRSRTGSLPQYKSFEDAKKELIGYFETQEFKYQNAKNNWLNAKEHHI